MPSTLNYLKSMAVILREVYVFGIILELKYILNWFQQYRPMTTQYGNGTIKWITFTESESQLNAEFLDGANISGDDHWTGTVANMIPRDSRDSLDSRYNTCWKFMIAVPLVWLFMSSWHKAWIHQVTK